MNRFFCAVLLLASLPVLPALAAVDIETQARDIEGRLMAPCCRANTVAEHYSPVAAEMRQEIRAMLREGQTQEQILAFYVKEHGDQILAMPAAEGFNLVVWLVPLVFLLVGPGLIYLVLRGWKSKQEAASAAAPAVPATPVDPQYAKRLADSLARLE